MMLRRKSRRNQFRTTRLTFFIGSLLLCLSLICRAETEESAILSVMQAQEAAWNKGDLVAFMQGYWQSPELTFVGQSGLKKGWQTTLENYQKTYPDKDAMGKLRFDVLQVDVVENTAFVLGQWSLKRSQGDVAGYYTLHWRKIDGQWKIVIDHSS